MKLEINLDDYISEEEKKQLLKDTFVKVMREKFERDYELILANSAYDIVFKAVDDEVNGQAKELIKDKVIKIINKMSHFCIFSEREATHGKKELSIAQQYLNDAVTQSKDLIYNKVKLLVDEKLSSLTSNENYDKTAEIIEDVVSRVIYEKLTS